MPRNLGDAFVRVRPDTSGFGKELGTEVTAGAPAQEVTKSGSKVGSFLGKALKVGALAAVGTAGAVLGVALTKGFQRLSAIDEAKKKLEGLGHSTSQVDKIMTNALAAVKGTAFGLDEAATVSATAVAAGIKPGKQLTKVLTTVADAATIGGTSMQEMGDIFNKVAASNKLQGDTIQQLNQRGIPILQLLSKSLGKSTDQVLKLSKKGQISFADFEKAMEKGLGGAAKKSGATFTGSWKNLMASLSRIGAGLLGGIFPHLAPTIRSITKAMGPLEDIAAKVGDKIGKKLAPVLAKAGPLLAKFITWLSHPDLSGAGSTFSKIGASFGKLGDAIGQVDWGKVKDAFGSGVSDSISVFSVVIGFLARHLQTFAKILPELIALWAAYNALQAVSKVLALANIPARAANTAALLISAKANRSLATQMQIANGVQTESTAITIRQRVATIASTVASKAAAVAAKGWAIAQRVLNAAMKANPLGLIITAITLLVGGLILAYKKSETFRKIVNGALHAVGAAGKWLWNNALKPAFNAIVKAFDAVKKAVNFLWDKVLKPVFRLWVNTFLTVVGAIINGAAKAFGWVPGIGGKLKKAAGWFDDFKNQVNRSLDGVHNHLKITADTSAARSAVAGLSTYISSLGKRVSTAELHVASLYAKRANYPRRAGGGSVVAGKPYIVGEYRPEVFVPNANGRILPRVPDGQGAQINVYDRSGSPRQTAHEVVRRMAFAGGV